MAVVALVTWVIAALGGFYLLATWLQRGGMRQQHGGPTRFPAGLVFGHFLFAAAGLVVWLVYVLGESSASAGVALVLVVITALLGFTMFARWLSGRGSAAGSTAEVAAERHLPVAVVLAHGLFAAVTLVLVLVAALSA